ncbi:hypothetical protein [uncultured Roseobacter sp.]|uniref:hypothetical protein n=1 Tax=uncultured Roseobacter sp. TaxID=114847 RepID=UPI00261C337B|nr:hypothetical protein [uncultured Roseobacter sp.]
MQPAYFDEFTEREPTPRSRSFSVDIRSPRDELETVTVTERADQDEASVFWAPVFSLKSRIVPEVALISVFVM